MSVSKKNSIVDCIEGTCRALHATDVYEPCIYTCLSGGGKDGQPTGSRVSKLAECIQKGCSLFSGYDYGLCVLSNCIQLTSATSNTDKVATNGIISGITVHSPVKGVNSGAAKRSWDDPVQYCIDFHCESTRPGTMHYSMCVHQHCSKFILRR